MNRAILLKASLRLQSGPSFFGKRFSFKQSLLSSIKLFGLDSALLFSCLLNTSCVDAVLSS